MHEVKRDLLTLRRAIWPLRETVNSLVREPTPFISDETRIYLRDCYDHTIQIIDLLENYRDVASGLMEVYLSSVSNRMNEIMKVLTMFTAFFIPLSLIAGIYGMNFNTARSPLNMPELNWYLGYPFALGLMAAIALGMLTFFRRKGWLRFPVGLRSARAQGLSEAGGQGFAFPTGVARPCAQAVVVRAAAPAVDPAEHGIGTLLVRPAPARSSSRFRLMSANTPPSAGACRSCRRRRGRSACRS